jgi:hypothetical protein
MIDETFIVPKKDNNPQLTREPLQNNEIQVQQNKSQQLQVT